MNLHRTILDRLKSHPVEIRRFTDGLTDEQLRKRPSEGKWSLHEITMHICDGQDVFVERVARMLTEDKPKFATFQPDEARQHGHHLTEDFKKRLKEFEVQRNTFASLLQTLNESQWKLGGIHPEMKKYTIEKAAESLMRHEESHLYQMCNVFFGIQDQ